MAKRAKWSLSIVNKKTLFYIIERYLQFIWILSGSLYMFAYLFIKTRIRRRAKEV